MTTKRLTTNTAARRVGCSVQLIRKALVSKPPRLRGEKLGRDWFISEADLAAFKILPKGRPAKKTKR